MKTGKLIGNSPTIIPKTTSDLGVELLPEEEVLHLSLMVRESEQDRSCYSTISNGTLAWPILWL